MNGNAHKRNWYKQCIIYMFVTCKVDMGRPDSNKFCIKLISFKSNTFEFPFLKKNCFISLVLSVLLTAFSLCLYSSQECPRLCAQAPCLPLPVSSALIWPVLSPGRRRRPHRKARSLALAWPTGPRSPLPHWTHLFRTWCPLLITTQR